MSICFQGKYDWFGYTNIYDPWFSYFLNTETESQLYKLTFDKYLPIGVLSSIACWCHHHRQWEKVFNFFTMPSGRHGHTKFVLCGARGADAPVTVIADLTIKNTEFSERLTSHSSPPEDPLDTEIEIIERELLSAIYQLTKKKISFAPISQEDLERYLEFRGGSMRVTN